jgi:ribosomal protein L11 methyltransferase
LSYVLDRLETQGIEFVEESIQAISLKAYFSPDSDTACLCRQLQESWKELRLPAADLRIVSIEGIEPRNWVGEWHSQYRPIRIGKRILIVPSWHRGTVPPELLTIRMDPQNAFGSGTHASTRLCLLGIEEYYRSAMRAVDIGTGSGILAIAMARLDQAVRPPAESERMIWAIDSDPEAIATARKNARRNRVSGLIRFRAVPAESFRYSNYAFLTANLTAGDLIDQAAGLAASCGTGALLLLSGLQLSDAAEVRRAYQKHGCRLLKTRTQEGWALLVLRKQITPPGDICNAGL